MVLQTPIVPKTIVVHLGRPDQAANNIRLSFTDYIKNVASSEIYPTWPTEALKANIYAQISYTLNRIYTEWYRSQGYDFDITNSTQFDHYFVPNRDIFESISLIVDEIFDTYIRRIGQVAPYISPYCDGVRTICNGLSQWGSVDLAEQGMSAIEILRYYYGDDIELVSNTPVVGYQESYPGYPLRLGDFYYDVLLMQTRLNRIAGNYPTIPKIYPVNGVFNVLTQSAVRKFQEIFDLEPDGIIGKSTWYRIQYIYTVVKNLAEVESEGVNYGYETWQYPREDLTLGATVRGVDILQYFLTVIGSFNPEIPVISITGVFDQATASAVESFQRYYGLPVTGVVDYATWNGIFDEFIATEDAIPGTVTAVPIKPYGGVLLRTGSTGEDVYLLQEYLLQISEYYPEIPAVEITGTFDNQTRNAVLAFQRQFALTADGIVGQSTWSSILEVYRSVLRLINPNIPQFPGRTLTEGQTDREG